jgi:hypothetical protein
MKFPVGIKIATGAQGANSDYRFGTLHAPPSPGTIQSILDQMTAGTFIIPDVMGSPSERKES